MRTMRFQKCFSIEKNNRMKLGPRMSPPPSNCLVNLIIELKYKNQEANFNVLLPGMGEKNPSNPGLSCYVVSLICVCTTPTKRASNCWDLAGHSAMFALSLTCSVTNLRRRNLQCLNSFFLSAWICGPFLFKLHPYFSSNDY